MHRLERCFEAGRAKKSFARPGTESRQRALGREANFPKPRHRSKYVISATIACRLDGVLESWPCKWPVIGVCIAFLDTAKILK